MQSWSDHPSRRAKTIGMSGMRVSNNADCDLFYLHKWHLRFVNLDFDAAWDVLKSSQKCFRVTVLMW